MAQPGSWFWLKKWFLGSTWAGGWGALGLPDGPSESFCREWERRAIAFRSSFKNT